MRFEQIVLDNGLQVIAEIHPGAHSAAVGVFVDGPVHDHPAQAERDTGAEERLIDAGWTVIRVRHDGDWGAVVARFQSVFGPGRAA